MFASLAPWTSLGLSALLHTVGTEEPSCKDVTMWSPAQSPTRSKGPVDTGLLALLRGRALGTLFCAPFALGLALGIRH